MSYGINTMRMAARWLLERRERARQRFRLTWYTLTEARKLHPLRGLYSGERCFIIGNGPSLKMHDLTRLVQEKKFVTNMFFLHPQWEMLHLDFFCSVDDMHWPREGFPELWKKAFVKLPYCKFFLNRTAIPIARKTKELQGREIYFVNCDFSKHVYEGDFSVDIPRYTALGWTVIVDLCLPLAFYMGFTEVFLLGCDHDYHIEEAPDLSAAYFYDKRLDRRPIDQYLWECTDERNKLVFPSYRVVKDFFEAAGRRVYNAGYGGKLEVFERVNYDGLF